MHIARVQIAGFRNFRSLDVALSPNVVMVGENRAGKSNFILALRLVLDASLPDSVRQLKLSDIWDGHNPDADPRVEVHLDFTGFDTDPALTALLTDYRIATDHTVARLSYVFRKKTEVDGRATSEADFEFVVFGGDDETQGISSSVRRRLCLDLLPALRDAEAELGSWRQSPLRPLLEEAISAVPQEDLEAVAQDINAATDRLRSLQPIGTLEESLRRQIADLAGEAQDIRAKLQFTPTDPLRLFRTIRVFIDDGKRSLNDASVGSANLALLTLKLAEFAWRREKNERNYTIACIEEPEAHLHPHLQRTIFQKLFQQTNGGLSHSLVLTTHSPNVASIAPLRSIVLLKRDPEGSTYGHSLANLNLEQGEVDDLERYLDAARAEILFSRAVVFVEGLAEVTLLPLFAAALGFDLDEHGITVCNVGGTHFSPYVKLACALGMPFSVITDWDPPQDGRKPRGWVRCLDLLADIRTTTGTAEPTNEEMQTLRGDEEAIRAAAARFGVFVNTSTFELELAATPAISGSLLGVLQEEEFGPTRQARIAAWRADPASIDGEQLLAMIADIGKGRLASRIAEGIVHLQPPAYIEAALRHILPRD